MTKYRHEYLQRSLPLADSGEMVFDLGGADLITRLDVEFRATNGTTNNKAVHIADVLTSFELMDGSEVVISLSGYELAGLVANRLGRMPQGVVSEVPSVEQVLRFPVDFGRWYADEDMSLDPSKLDNLQIRIVWNLAAVRPTGATGFAAGSGRLTLIAHVMEGARNPLAYLVAKRHAMFTTVASGEVRNPLPVDHPIRAVMIRSYEAGVGQLSGISQVRLTLDEGKERPIDFTVADFLQSIVNAQNPFHYVHDFHLQNTNVAFALLKYREGVKTNTNNILALSQYTHANIGQGVMILSNTTTGAGITTDTPIYGTVQGYLPFSCAYWGFGTYDNPDTWLHAPSYNKAHLFLTQNDAGAATSVVVEQQVNY